MISRTGAARLLLVLVSVSGGLLQLYSTSQGAGISPDSTRYVAAARSLLRGEGLQQFGPTGEAEPLSVWAPLYPVVLALEVRAGIDIFDGARFTNAVLFAANLFLAGLIVSRISPSSSLAPTLAASLLLISPDFAEVHAWIWTEPLALFLGFLGLYWLDRTRAAPKPTAVLPAAFLIAGSCLVRYASLPFVAAGILGILLLGRGRAGRDRWARALLFGTASLLPTAIWLAQTLRLTGQAAGRVFGYRSNGLDRLESGLSIVADWILPGRITGDVRTWVGAAFLLLWLFGAFGLLAYRIREVKALPEKPVSILAELLSLFVLCYAAMIVGTTLYLSPGVSISDRIFSVGHSAILVGIVGYAAEFYSGFPARLGARINLPRPVRWACVAALAGSLGLWAGFRATHTWKWAVSSHATGQGYGDRSWRESPLIGFLRELPEGVPIYSNGPDAVYILTERPARTLPDWPGGDPQAGVELPPPIARMRDELAGGQGVIVYFRGINWRSTLTEVELKRLFALRPLFGNEQGSIYGLAPSSSGNPPADFGSVYGP